MILYDINFNPKFVFQKSKSSISEISFFNKCIYFDIVVSVYEYVHSVCSLFLFLLSVVFINIYLKWKLKKMDLSASDFGSS